MVSLRWPHRRTHRASAGPATVAAFLAHEADRGSRAATITRGCAAIRYAIGSPTWRPPPTDREPPTNSEHVRAALHSPHRRGSPYMAERRKGATQLVAAARAGLSERSGRPLRK